MAGGDAEGVTCDSRRRCLRRPLEAGSRRNYLLTDHLGSIVAVTDEDGELLDEQRYEPFGLVRENVGSITQTDLSYTEQRAITNTGLLDYKARAYDPLQMRFVQPDSIVPRPAEPQGFNRYSYVLNGPINLNDPTGHWADEGCGRSGECELPEIKGPKTEYAFEDFQLLQGYELYEVDPSATGVYSDFPGGGDPKYFWRVPGAPGQGGPSAGWYDGLGIVNDQLAGWRDPYQRAHMPYDQSIRISYQISYDGAPRMNASKTINIVGMQITNGSSIDMTVHYSVSIAGGGRNILTGGSAGRGGSTDLPGTYGIAARNREQAPHIVAHASGTSGSLQFYGWADFVFYP